MSELPKGWARKKLSDVALVNMGQSPKGEFVNQEHEGLPFYQGKAEFGALYPTPRKWCVKPTKIAEKDDILMSIRAPVGPTNYCPETSCIGRGLASVRAHEKISQHYLFYYFKSIEPWLSNQGTGSTFKAISGKFLRDVDVVLAPLEEQKRIADKLDSVLAKVEAAQARLDKIPTILKRFRQSVLAAATSGELTKDWREDNEQFREEKSTWLIKKLPLSWDVKLLPDVASSRLGKMLDKSKNTGLATKYLGNVNLRWHSFDLDDLKEILVSKKEIDELSIKDGDLLLCEGGEPGRGAVWRGGENDLVFQKAIHRVRCSDELIPEFLLFCIEDDYFSKRLSLLYTGTTIKHLTGKSLKMYPVKLPTVDEQLEIVDRVAALVEHSKAVEKQYNAAKARLDKLTQSILAKAFRGELIAQDPNDEPASELLKRIKSSKVESKPKKKTPPSSKAANTKTKIAKQPITDISEQLEEESINDLDAEMHQVVDSLRVSYQTEIKKAQGSLVDAKFSVEQFRSITDFKGDYDELKTLIMNLLKGIPNVSEPLMTVESWNEKSGDYLMRLVKQK